MPLTGRQVHGGVVPAVDPHHQARHHGQRAFAPGTQGTTGKGHHPLSVTPAHGQPFVAALGPEEVGAATAQVQRPGGDQKLGKPVVAAGKHLLGPHVPQLGEEPPALLVVHGPAVVRVHQAQVPQLGALVGVGYAWSSELYESLGQSGNAPGRHEGSDEAGQIGQERPVTQHR